MNRPTSRPPFRLRDLFLLLAIFILSGAVSIGVTVLLVRFVWHLMIGGQP